MLRDVFYYGKKPNVHPREKPAKDLEDARKQATTEHFWIVNEFCDYSNIDWDFDFDYLPDTTSWHGEHNNAWPSVHQKDSGTWLCPKEHSQHIIYRDDVEPLKRYVDMSNWVLLDKVDESKFDFSWHHDPTEPPFIYKWGCKFFEAEIKHVLEYRTPGAFQEKYMETIVELEPEYDKIVEVQAIDKTKFDISWRPDPREPAYIYIWGNKYVDGKIKSTFEYHTTGATDKKYMKKLLDVLPEYDRWNIIERVDESTFDFSWRPDPREPAFIYVWGNKYYNGEYGATLEYHTPGATERKYMTNDVGVLPLMENYKILHEVENFDFCWRPNPKDPPYIYVFGNQFYPAEIDPTVEYHTPGATERKYVNDIVAKLKPSKNNYKILTPINEEKFDFSWKPNPKDPPYIYVFGNQWHSGEKDPTVMYMVPGATDYKYINETVAEVLPNKANYEILHPIVDGSFDFSWRPDPFDPAYIYVFGNNRYDGKLMPTIRYKVPGATDIKHVDTLKATLDINMKNWTVPDNIDTTDFDFSWIPDPTSPPYIYEFATVWNDRGGPRYTVKGSTEFKYITEITAKTKINKKHWKHVLPIDQSKFDYSWTPHPDAPPYIYVFGNQWNRAERESTVEYHVPGATDYKYINDIVATVLADQSKFETIIPVSDFDFSWRPDPYDPPYIYVFGNTQYPAEIMPTIRYKVEGATEEKFIDTIKATLAPNTKNWHEIIPINKDKFDYSWVPDPKAPPYIYVLGNQYNSAEIEPTIEYRVPGATERSYVHDKIAYTLPDKSKFKELLPVDETKFDFSWRPNPKDPPYIYVFGNQWHMGTIEPTIEYHIKGATDYKYINDIIAYVKPDKTNYKILQNIVEESFDFSWRPNPKDPPYIYVFGNQWFSAEKDHTVYYEVEGATEYKYVHEFTADLAEDYTNWDIPEGINIDNFDFSWKPDPGSPPYIYQFGTLADDNDGPRYVHPNNTGEVVRLLRVERKNTTLEVSKYYIETTLEDLIEEHKNEVFWALNKNINYDDFDFDWRPSIEQARYIHVFGSPESQLTQTYFVSGRMYQLGYRELNFVEQNVKVESEYLAKLFKPSDAFFIDRGNIESSVRFEQLKVKFPNIVKTRYLNSWAETIERCLRRCTTQLAWILNSELDYTDFDFQYYPNPWQMKMVHVFGTQWSHWGTTFMVNKETFPVDTKYVKVIEHLSNLNFVKNRTAKATNCLHDIYVIDHGNKETEIVIELLKNKAGTKKVEVVRYDKSYLNTFREILKIVEPAKENYIWVTSSICDYTAFDFSFICDPFAKDNLHVFPTHQQKFGDTFLVDVNKLQSLINDMNLLEDYGKVQYAYQQRAARLPAPVFVTDEDTHRKCTTVDFDFPYACFKTKDNENLDINYIKPISLWTEESKNIEILSTGGTVLIVPKEVRNYVTEELYDYPYISKADTLAKSKPIDIVFLSNGEMIADKHWNYLLKVTKGLSNRVVRIDGVNGRAAAYHAAAEASETPWFFAVFAKLEVNNKFNFNWQPDRLQVSKHYIFNALNPVNKLVYGHQAMIAYNKKLVLNNPGRGLDFTLDDEHEVVDQLSGIARFNTDKYSTWRTAFREVIKLKSDYKDVSHERLQTWLNIAEGDYAEDCLLGAKDGVEYYNSVGGDIEQLKLSYEWDWLNNYYKGKYL